MTKIFTLIGEISDFRWKQSASTPIVPANARMGCFTFFDSQTYGPCPGSGIATRHKAMRPGRRTKHFGEIPDTAKAVATNDGIGNHALTITLARRDRTFPYPESARGGFANLPPSQ